jgi:imidazolonepropionase-like amidohydrolase
MLVDLIPGPYWCRRRYTVLALSHEHSKVTSEQSRAGMSFQEILASLTTSPAQRFGYATHSGRIAKGLDADLVVLSADPAQKISAFSKVRYTIRSGEVIYAEK